MTAADDLDTRRIEFIRNELKQRLVKEKISATFTFKEIEQMPLFGNRLAFARVLSLIKDHSDGKMDFDTADGAPQIFLGHNPRAGSVMDTFEPTPPPTVMPGQQIGYEVTVSDPSKLDEYFSSITQHLLQSSMWGIGQDEKVVTAVSVPTPELPPVQNKHYRPRLFSKKVGSSEAGFLRLYDSGKAYKIAGIKTRQFLLVRCFFSPDGLTEAVYIPAFRTHESIYEAIKLPKDRLNGRLRDTATRDAEIRAIIKWTIKELQKNRGIRNYLRFDQETHRMRLRITLPEGRD